MKKKYLGSRFFLWKKSKLIFVSSVNSSRKWFRILFHDMIAMKEFSSVFIFIRGFQFSSCVSKSICSNLFHYVKKNFLATFFQSFCNVISLQNVIRYFWKSFIQIWVPHTHSMEISECFNTHSYVKSILSKWIAESQKLVCRQF